MSLIDIGHIELDELPTLERGHSSQQAKKPKEDEIITESRSPRPSLLPSGSLENVVVSFSPVSGLRIGKLFVEDNVLYLIGSCLGVFTVGLNDTATGANLPSIQKHYGLSYELVSFVFLAGFGGYMVSCPLNPILQRTIGTRWVLLTGGIFYAGGALLIAFAPPFSLVMFGLALMGFGGGICDTCLTSVVAHFENKRFMNILYAFFGVGALSAPFVIGGFNTADIPWNRYYWLPFALEVLIIAVSFIIFRRYEPPSDSESHGHSTTRARLSQMTRTRVFWVGIVLTILSYAMVDTLTNWLTSYLIEVKGSEPGVSRYQQSMLWAGLTAGRFFFSLPHIHIRERIGNTILLASLCGSIAVLWTAKAATSTWVVIVLAGFFMGPNSPAILSIVSVRVPPSMKSAAVSIVVGCGLVGSALGPLIFGVAAGKIVPGLRVLPPVIIVLASLSALIFWAIPPREKRD